MEEFEGEENVTRGINDSGNTQEHSSAAVRPEVETLQQLIQSLHLSTTVTEDMKLQQLEGASDLLLNQWLREVGVVSVSDRAIIMGKLTKPEVTVPSSARCCGVDLYKVPILNILYDMLFDDPPAVEKVQEVMNIIGLLSGLMLAVVITIPASVTYDDLLAVTTRWGPGGVYSNCWIDGWGQIEFWNKKLMFSIGAFFD